MEENDQIMEQPGNEQLQGLDVNNFKENGNIDKESGSMFGKFKDANSLLQAYNNLQSEFTRKSQLLSELKKGDNSKDSSNVLNEGENFNEEVSNSVSDLTTVQTVDDTTMQTAENAVSLGHNDVSVEPHFLSDGWQNDVKEFLNNNPSAVKWASQISELIASDKVLAKNPNSLEIAYGRVLAKNFKNPLQLVEDEEFITGHILTNNDIRQRVINQYLRDVKNNTTPPLIVSGGGAQTSVTTNSKPKTLSEANKIVERMLKQK